VDVANRCVDRVQAANFPAEAKQFAEFTAGNEPVVHLADGLVELLYGVVQRFADFAYGCEELQQPVVEHPAAARDLLGVFLLFLDAPSVGECAEVAQKQQR